ncbi:hypothetical protein [Simkania sp.]|uniref:hypothetical protein n=1 Tax=Simkania sp. TaxID=34094 RepID=UPI003B524D18
MAATLESNHSKLSQTFEGQSFQIESEGVSNAALEVADTQEQTQETAKKVAYYWIKMDLDDPGLSSKFGQESHEISFLRLENAGYEVTTVIGNQGFLEHTSQDLRHPDLILIRGHGNPWCLEDFEVSGDNIVSTDPNLSASERVEIIDRLSSILDEGSVLGLSGCATGNKSVQNNFACVTSKVCPQTKVLAFQELVYGLGIPVFEEVPNQTGLRVTSLKGGSKKLKGQETSVVYENGVETSGQEALRLPRMFREQKTQRMSRTVVASAIFIGGAALFAVGASMGFSPYDVYDMTASTLSALF